MNREIDNFHERIEKRLGAIEDHLATLNGRTSKLERWKGWMMGGLSAIGFLTGGGAVTAVILTFV